MTTRSQMRDAVATLLQSVSIAPTTPSSFVAVYKSPRRTLDGQSPVAIVSSAGLTARTMTRGGGVDELEYRLLATLYVRCDGDADADAVESVLDDFTRATAVALVNAGYQVDATDANAEGAPLRLIDGELYRVERLDIRQEVYA